MEYVNSREPRPSWQTLIPEWPIPLKGTPRTVMCRHHLLMPPAMAAVVRLWFCHRRRPRMCRSMSRAAPVLKKGAGVRRGLRWIFSAHIFVNFLLCDDDFLIKRGLCLFDKHMFRSRRVYHIFRVGTSVLFDNFSANVSLPCCRSEGCRYICANAFRRSVRKANGRAPDMIAGEKGNAEKALETEAGDDRIRKEPGKTERNWRAHTLPMDCFKGHKIKKMNPEQMVIDHIKPTV